MLQNRCKKEPTPSEIRRQAMRSVMPTMCFFFVRMSRIGRFHGKYWDGIFPHSNEHRSRISRYTLAVKESTARHLFFKIQRIEASAVRCFVKFGTLPV